MKKYIAIFIFVLGVVGVTFFLLRENKIQKTLQEKASKKSEQPAVNQAKNQKAGESALQELSKEIINKIPGLTEDEKSFLVRVHSTLNAVGDKAKKDETKLALDIVNKGAAYAKMFNELIPKLNDEKSLTLKHELVYLIEKASARGVKDTIYTILRDDIDAYNKQNREYVDLSTQDYNHMNRLAIFDTSLEYLWKNEDTNSLGSFLKAELSQCSRNSNCRQIVKKMKQEGFEEEQILALLPATFDSTNF